MQVKIEGKEIVIRVPYEPTNAYPISKSGKSRIVDTSNGFVPIAGTDIKVGLNVIKPV